MRARGPRDHVRPGVLSGLHMGSTVRPTIELAERKRAKPAVAPRMR
jgi:hypothetical protein